MVASIIWKLHKTQNAEGNLKMAPPLRGPDPVPQGRPPSGVVSPCALRPARYCARKPTRRAVCKSP